MTTPPLDARASRLRGARALFTGRGGGASTGPYAGANLALHVGDDPQAVLANRAALRARMDVPVLFVDQVHSADVAVIDARSEIGGDAEGQVRTADALVTDRDDVALAIMVADCLPVLLADAEAGVIGAAHAGRVGLLGGVLEATVAEMIALGARAERIAARIGPSICGQCYEVPEQMCQDASAALPSIAARTRWGTPGLDLRAGAREALGRIGVLDVGIDGPCTAEDPGCFSYRRESVTGRQAGVIALA